MAEGTNTKYMLTAVYHAVVVGLEVGLRWNLFDKIYRIRKMDDMDGHGRGI